MRQVIVPKIRPIFTALMIIAILLAGVPIVSLQARTQQEIQDEIDKQKQSLNGVESELAAAEKNLANMQSAMNGAQGEIPRLQAEIDQIVAEIEFNTLQIKLLEESKRLKGLEQEQREEQQDDAVSDAYMDWRTRSKFASFLTNNRSMHPMKLDAYQGAVLSQEKVGIEALIASIQEIQTKLGEYASESTTLAQQNAELSARKAQLQSQILALQSSINSTGGVVAGLRSEAGILKANLNQLSAEQRAVQDYEAWLLSQSGNGGTNTLQGGQIFFSGQGRDLAQGHGTGMSQYGAKGAADQGWTAEQILQFYYPGATVGQYALNSAISVKYCPGNPALDPYQDGCDGGAAAVIERVPFDEYLAGLGEMPANWPWEARRAQMIAARTYAARYTNNGDPAYPICLTTYCQVSYFRNGYNQNEWQTVVSTRDLVVTYGGELIEALYSADNNQGSGPGDHDTRFQNIWGGATGSRPYLVSVNDNQFAANSRMYWQYYCPGAPCGLWEWRTNSYTYAQIDQMLDHVNHNSTYAVVAPQVNEIRNAIGNVVDIYMVKDGSGRVKKVALRGSTGVTREIGGWWFKSIWNSWIYDVRPSGQLDYMYSQTFTMYPV